MNILSTKRRFDFDPLHVAMQRQVDLGFLPGVATAVLVDGEVVDSFCTGWADKEAGIALRPDHIYRMFSNTKLVTACATLMLWEEGHFDLDDPIERFIPQLGQRRVLRDGATRMDDTEPAAGSITIRHLLTHSSGLSYGLFDPGTLLYQVYTGAKVLNPGTTLAEKMDALAPLPLKFHPGTGWEYSIASDVTARLVEVVSGRRFGEFLAERIFTPLGMVDTGFVVPPGELQRLCAYYGGVDFADPTKPGLVRYDDLPYPGAYRTPVPYQGGGGGLVSTLDDTVRLIKAVLPGSTKVLKPSTLKLMAQNHLAAGLCVEFPFMRYEGMGFGLGSAVIMKPGPYDPKDSTGEFLWSGLGGTHWWVNPGANVAGVLMTQRHMGAMNPYAYEFKMLAYRAAGLH
ncbi:MAG TPA: serine hydrolase domain-containing protein [Ramlibacter sp.]|nr:serine hydrolase domain-containing protein [Ramlibacter sp.]